MIEQSMPSKLKTPAGNYRLQQARISRHLLYPVTAFYGLFSATVLLFALRSSHPWVGLCFYLAGVPVWTLNEYLFHRYVLHKHFPDGKNIVKHILHKHLDHLHWEHHRHPLSGENINGELKDTLPLFVVAAPLSFIFPIYTAPVLLGAVVLSYVSEEWIHHCVHFYKVRNPYFRYIKKHHFYHHSKHGEKKGYGVTSGFWDIIFKTRFPEDVRASLYGRKKQWALGFGQSSSRSLDVTPGR